MPILRVNGQLDISQFWPGGESDGDTAKVLVNNQSFEVDIKETGNFVTTHVFENATAKGKVSGQVIKNGKLTIRFQGIDAPELHYTAAPLPKTATAAQRAKYKAANGNFRQHFGQSSAFALGQFLASGGAGQGLMNCQVVTNVDSPNEVFDTYGRFIGDIIVHIGGKQQNLNQWMIEQGWAFPTFYNSMTEPEIKTILKLWQTGKSKVLGSFLIYDASNFDPSLLFKDGAPFTKKQKVFVLKSDKGQLLIPKFYRRQTAWSVNKKAGLFKGNYAAFIKKNTKIPDQFILVKDLFDFGASSAPVHNLVDFIKINKINLKIEDIAFVEAPSKLVDAKNVPIKNWQ